MRITRWLVALDEPGKRIRFGSCKRSENALAKDAAILNGHAQRFLTQFPRYKSWKVELVGFAPVLGAEARKELAGRGLLAQDLSDLTTGL